MTNAYLLLKWLHIVSATVLLGTGAGIAFFLLRAHRTRDARIVAAVARDVVLADFVFTAVAVVVQLATGLAMLQIAGLPISLPWIRTSLIIYGAIGCCWVPVVWLQIRMRDLAAAAATAGQPLPPAYYRYFRWWLTLGWPAFAGVLLIIWLMVTKQGLSAYL